MEATVTFGTAGRVFWSYLWRVVAVTFLMGIPIGILGAIAPSLKPLFSFVNFVISIPVTWVIFGIVFHRRYKHFSVALVDATGSERPKRWQDNLRLWWSFTWRSALLLIVPMLVVGGLMVAMFVPNKEVIVHRTCQKQYAIYQQNYQNPQTAAVAAQAAETYTKLNCQTVLAQKPPEKHITTPKMIGATMTVLLGFAVCILIQIQVFKILLTKQYRHFRVTTVATEAA